jgi:hypothetical protein
MDLENKVRAAFAPFCTDEKAMLLVLDCLSSGGSIGEAMREWLRYQEPRSMRPATAEEISAFVAGYDKARRRYA